MKIKKIIIPLVSIGFFISSCAWDKTPLVGGSGDGVKDSICFEKEIQPIINSNCAKSGCHDAITAEEGYDFTTYFGIMEIVEPGKPNDSELMEVIKESGDDVMPPPPNPPLSQEQIDLLSQWISEGAGIGVDCFVAVECDTSNVTYSETIVAILQTNCLGCHSTTSTGGGILLNSYAGVKEQVNNGKLLGSITWQSGYQQMPQNAAQLSACDITKFEIWIDSGAPNN